MKRFTPILIILLYVTNLFSQIDGVNLSKRAFEFQNIYRVYNGVPTIEWSEELYILSKKHNDFLIERTKNSLGVVLSHSNDNINENCVFFTTKNDFKLTIGDDTKLKEFVKEVFRIELETLSTLDMLAIYPIFLWDSSEPHKLNMLKYGIKQGSLELNHSTYNISLTHNNQDFNVLIKKFYGTSNYK